MSLARAALLLHLGCGGGEAPAPGPANPPAREDARAALLAAARAPLGRCRQIMGPFAAEEPPPRSPPVRLEAIEAACAEAAALYDAHAPTLLGRGASVDLLLIDLARVGDELDYVRRRWPRGSDTPEARNAATHLADALREAESRLQQVEARPGEPYGVVALPDDARWAAQVRADRADLARRRDLLERLAFRQGSDPRETRRRVLEAVLLTGAARDAPRRARSSAGQGPSARAPYERAWGAARDALDAVTRRVIDGAVMDLEARRTAIALADEAVARHADAHDAELRRLSAP